MKASESTWTIEDRKLLVVVLPKLKRHDQWSSVVVGQGGAVDAATFEKMKKQMMLEKFQNEVGARDNCSSPLTQHPRHASSESGL